MKYAYIQNNTALEVVASDPFTLFVPHYASQFVEVPEVVHAGWALNAGQWAPPVPTLPTREELAAEIDKASDALRLSIVGDPLRVEEYRIAREEATAFVAANYSGTVPSSVQSWATAKSWTPKQAADDIMHTAQLWSSALYAIRTIRLVGKEAVRNAADAAAVNTAYQTAINQLTALKGAM